MDDGKLDHNSCYYSKRDFFCKVVQIAFIGSSISKKLVRSVKFEIMSLYRGASCKTGRCGKSDLFC